MILINYRLKKSVDIIFLYIFDRILCSYLFQCGYVIIILIHLYLINM